MERFIERHRDRVVGVLSGFDRILFRGSLRSICYLKGLEIFLSSHRVLNKDFGKFVENLSGRIKRHAEEIARQRGRPFRYLASSSESKEDVARAVMQRDGITHGLVCVLSCVEPCQTYALRRDRATKHLLVVPAQRKCLHLYFYFVDREFGLMHVRVQTWLPFTLHVCLNGREYLARQLDRAKIAYDKRDNCFAKIDNLPRAQAILDRLTHRKWERFLGVLSRRVNPLLVAAAGLDLYGYYWSIRQGEYATDVMFRDDAALAEVYPALVDHAIRQFRCQDVLRFLGRRTNTRFNGEVTSDIKHRLEGVRIKHRVEENSIKMYDKQGSVLRIETTLNNPRRFRVRRRMTRNGRRVMGWVPMRYGLADMARRVELSRAANQRYLEALAVVGQPAPTRELLDPLSRRVLRDGRPYRPLRPITPEESVLYQELLRGDHLVQGIRNPDVRRALYPDDERDPSRRRRASGRVTRWFRLLRAHGLIRKVSHTRYYRATDKGHHVMTTALKLREIDVSRLAA